MPATCPECDSQIDLDEMDVDVGDELSCSECGALLRVSSDAPLELELADEDEDEEDEDDDFDDDDEAEDEDEDIDDEDEEGWSDDTEDEE